MALMTLSVYLVSDLDDLSVPVNWGEFRTGVGHMSPFSLLWPLTSPVPCQPQMLSGELLQPLKRGDHCTCICHSSAYACMLFMIERLHCACVNVCGVLPLLALQHWGSINNLATQCRTQCYTQHSTFSCSLPPDSLGFICLLLAFSLFCQLSLHVNIKIVIGHS